MRTGLHRYTNLKVLVEKLIVAVGGFLDRNRPNRRPVEQQLHLVRLRVPQAVDVSGIAAREVNLDVVLSVLHEIVTNRNPTTRADRESRDRKSTRLNSSHVKISYAVFCLKKKKTT